MQALAGVHGSRLEPGVPGEDTLDDAIVLFFLEAARRIEEKAAGSEKCRPGKKALFLRAAEPIDRFRGHAIADLGVLAKHPRAAARRVEEDAVEPAGRQRRRQNVARGGNDRGDAEAFAVFQDKIKPRHGAVEREGPSKAHVENRRKRLSSGRRREIHERVAGWEKQRQGLRRDVGNGEVAGAEEGGPKRVSGYERQG